jgi:hypothetical protein
MNQTIRATMPDMHVSSPAVGRSGLRPYVDAAGRIPA